MSATKLAALLSVLALGILIGATCAAIWTARTLPLIAFAMGALLLWLIYLAYSAIRDAGQPRVPTHVRRPADDLQYATAGPAGSTDEVHMFHLKNNPAAVSNVNLRIEKHGDERHLAVDLSITTSTSNLVLDHFDKELRKALFRKAGKGEQQSLPTIAEVLTEIKIPSLEPIKVGHEFKGFELQIDGELDSTQPIFLVDVKLKKFVIAPKEGGSVELSFKASASVTPDEVAELTEALIRENVVLSLQPGQAEETTQQDDLAA
ncbi:MAG: hypothetical protein GAK31_01709 [Stenotrophomonas maltophilia]|uniref:Transmembrane protein n=1 Tax=Stenotrophomonas maltophilia TaxID=40324 RepID=A0A7V8FI08_STEMA|nr:MAG: hypothetical protein GAK31_01709 [Stenotrophomonas maltophilia]